MKVGDDARVATRCAPPQENRKRVVCSLDDHCVGPEVAQLTHHPERQREVEDETVDEPRTDRRDEMERVVARRLVTLRGREDTHFRDLLERIELLL